MNDVVSKRFRSPVAGALTLAVFAVLVTGQAGAQTPPPATPPTTTNLIEELVRNLLAPPTTPPPAPPTTAAAPAPAAAAPKAAAPPGPTTTTTTPPGVIPPQFLSAINSVRRTGGRTTAPLLDALRPLLELGMTPQEIAIAGFGHFPVAGDASYRDDWWEARFGPPFHLHEGTDIFALRGTPVRAPFAGTVRYDEGGLGGKGAYVTSSDGTYYYMAHLDSFNSRIRAGSAVKQGDVVGFVGDSGNAQGGSPHVHFEIHPRGGGAVNPKPILDQWLNEAVNNASALLAANSAGVSRAITGAGVLRRFDGLAPSESRAVGPLLWASSVSAGGGTIRLAQLQMARMAGRVDWDSMSSVAQAQADALREGREVARAILAPLTPPVLSPLLSSGS